MISMAVTEAGVDGPRPDASPSSPVRRLITQAWTREAIPWWVLAVGLLGASAMWLVLNSKMWFVGDTWFFIVHRGPIPSQDVGIWVPHNEHWSTLPVLLFRLLFSIFGLKHHLPYAVPLIVMHLVTCLALVRLMRRGGISRWTVVGVTLIIAFLGNGAENLEWEFQTGFMGSAMFGILAVMVLSAGRIGRWRIVAAWALLVAGLMCSGVGVTMLGCAALVVLLRRGVVRAVVVASVPTVVYGVWYLLYGRHAIVTPIQYQELGSLPRYVWTGLTMAWEKTTGIPGSGALIMLALMGTVLIAGRRHPAALALTVGAVVQLTMSGVVRVQLGVGQSEASRYAYLVCVYMSVGLGVAVDVLVKRLGRPRWFTGALVGLMCLAVIANGVVLAVANMVATRPGAIKERDSVFATLAIEKSGQKILNGGAADSTFAFITVDNLEAIRDKLPDGQASPQGYVDAASNLLVGTGAVTDYLPLASSVSVTGLAPSGPASGGCQTYLPTVGDEKIGFTVGDQGGRVRLTLGGTSYKTRLESGGLSGVLVDRTVPSSQPFSVGTSSRGGTLDILPTAGASVTVCTG